MNDTNTLINWPARLKIGARSKKGKKIVILLGIKDLVRDRVNDGATAA